MFTKQIKSVSNKEPDAVESYRPVVGWGISRQVECFGFKSYLKLSFPNV